MKYILAFVLYFSLLIWSVAGAKIYGQNRTIDSLLTLIYTDKPDTNKVNHLNRLAREYILKGDYDNALKSGNKALALSNFIPSGNKRGWTNGIASAYNYLGIIYYSQCNYQAALIKYFSALELRIYIGDKKGIGDCYNNIGMVYWKTGNFPLALKNYSTALKIRKDINDEKGISGSLNNIGIIYQIQGNYPEALKNLFASLKIKEKLDDQVGIANSFNNIGTIYLAQENYSGALKYYNATLKLYIDMKNKKAIANSFNNIGQVYWNSFNYAEALKNSLAALEIYDDINDKQGIANTYNGLGNIYFSQGNYPEALKKHSAALKMRNEIGDKQGIADSFVNLSLLHTKLNKLKVAYVFLNKALQLSYELGYKESIKKCYFEMMLLDSTQGNFKSAYQHHKLFIIYRDSIDNEETKKKTIESSMNYEFEKKESATKADQDKKDVIAEANKKKQQVVLILVSCVLLLVFVFAVFVVRSLRITRKQKNIIELQKNEVSRQKEMVSEKNKEITDSINYAQRIQSALLASDKMLNEHLNSPLQTNYLNFPYTIGEGVLLGRTDEARGAGDEASYFIFFQPKDIVSGDFYWASPLANGNFALITADSTGHGVPGAIMSMLNISCLNEAVKGQQLTAPNEILNYTRSKIIEHLSNDGSAEGGKDGMDCSLISIEHLSPSLEGQGVRLTYSAANNPIWIVRQKQTIELEPDKMPVGKHERDKISFTQHTIELQKNDIVYTITDGYADQFGGTKGKKYMAKQLKELLISICHLPMNEQREKLTAEFNNWKGNLEQVDDVTIIGIRV